MTTNLSEFNSSSARFIHFLVKVYGGRKCTYEYQTKQARETKKGEKFECYLVGANASDYMIGYVRGRRLRQLW